MRRSQTQRHIPILNLLALAALALTGATALVTDVVLLLGQIP